MKKKKKKGKRELIIEIRREQILYSKKKKKLDKSLAVSSSLPIILLNRIDSFTAIISYLLSYLVYTDY